MSSCNNTLPMEHDMSTRTANWHGMNWISQHKRLAIYIRDNFTCMHCGMDLRTLKRGDGLRIELDHVLPVSKNGSNAANNLITSCSACNVQRGDKDLEVVHPLLSQRAHIERALATPLNIHLAKQVLAAKKTARQGEKGV